MRVRSIDSNNDWIFGAGLRSYVRDSPAIAQNVRTALQSLAGDWFLDDGHGVRWFRYLRKNPDVRAMETELKTKVLNIDGVVRLTDFGIDLDVDTRACTISVSYTDVFGKENSEVIFHVRNN